MPKKSRRRANKASGGSSGRGAAGTVAGDANNRLSEGTAAKIFDGENNGVAAGGDDAGGILTRGAVTMFAQSARSKMTKYPRRKAPILQVSPDFSIEEVGDDFSFWGFALSDGERCMRAGIPTCTTNSNGGKLFARRDDAPLSMVRILRAMVKDGSKNDAILIVDAMEVVEKNVGRVIGNPIFLGHPSPSPYAFPPAPPSANAYPYAKKLGVAKAYHSKASRLFGEGKGDVKAALECLTDFFRFPREQTDPFRPTMLMAWRTMTVISSFEDEKKRGVTYAMSHMKFLTPPFMKLMRGLSSEAGGEALSVRALANYVLGIPFPEFSVSDLILKKTKYLRRFSVLRDKCNLAELAPLYDSVTGSSPGKGKMVITSMSRESNHYLEYYGGPPQSQVSSIFEMSKSNIVPFFQTVGGNFCDCCGKSAQDANLSVLFKCKACRLAWYCSKSCQSKCWAKGHRDHCKKFGNIGKGDAVMLSGLKTRPETNGTLVRVEELLGSGGRAAVQVLKPESSSLKVGMKLSIKLENLRHHRPLK